MEYRAPCVSTTEDEVKKTAPSIQKDNMVFLLENIETNGFWPVGHVVKIQLKMASSEL